MRYFVEVVRKSEILFELKKKVRQEARIPVTIGGGIRKEPEPLPRSIFIINKVAGDTYNHHY